MTLLYTGLLAGVLDGAAATLLFVARGNRRPALLFRFIASAVFGQRAFTAGPFMVAAGIFFHLVIALAWVGLYAGLRARIPWLAAHPLYGAILLGLLAWLVMNQVVVPLSKAAKRPFSWAFAVINMLILIVCIGLPAAYWLSTP